MRSVAILGDSAIIDIEILRRESAEDFFCIGGGWGGAEGGQRRIAHQNRVATVALPARLGERCGGGIEELLDRSGMNCGEVNRREEDGGGMGEVMQAEAEAAEHAEGVECVAVQVAGEMGEGLAHFEIVCAGDDDGGAAMGTEEVERVLCQRETAER